ncbi:MAG: transcriptional repressor LexA [Planctomycetota bacterium]|jgi:repressor LexA
MAQLPSDLPPLTRRQRQILDFYFEYSTEHGISPTLEEVAQHFELNKVTVFGHVAELERKGALKREQKGISRGLRVVTEEDRAATSNEPSVPLLGRIAAGAPLEALEAPSDLGWGDLVPKDEGLFALEVNGDSMIDDGIHQGDLALIAPHKRAEPGSTIVAIVHGEAAEEATLKRYYPLSDGGARLEPRNPTMKPFEVEAGNLEIRGVLVGLIRKV